MHDLSGARGLAGLFMMSLLAGCGGGSGGDASTGTVISMDAMSFKANAPDAATPTAQVFTATFGSDIAHLAVVHSGAAVDTVTSTLNGRTATITVQAAAPASVGPGAFVGAVAVTGYTCADATCSKLAAGTTSTVSVSYQVSPVVALVTPYAETSGVADEVVIRGLGFTSFNVQGIRFGDVAATAFTVGSSTEIRATHPALPAGTYPVRLIASNFDGDITTNATLVVADPTAYTAQTLSYPTAATDVRRVIYDTERRALLVLTDANSGSIVRYPSTGTSFGTPIESIEGFNDVALSAKGTSLYGISPTAVVVADPVTLAAGTPVTAPSLATGAFLKNIVVGNDDVGLITTGFNGSTATTPYLYLSSTNAVIQGSSAFNNATPAMTANGAGAYLIQGDPSLTADVLAAKYTTSSNSFSNAVTTLRQIGGIGPVISRTANRFILNGTRVYDTSEAFFGTLPTTTVAVALRADGARAYTYDRTLGGIVVFDVSVDRDEAAYAPLGAAVPVADPGNNPEMILSSDGGTLFLAGSAQVVVQPTPAL